MIGCKVEQNKDDIYVEPLHARITDGALFNPHRYKLPAHWNSIQLHVATIQADIL